MKIDHFRGEYAFLSNFWEVNVTYKGLTYGSNEAAFQAQKCMTEEEKMEFTQLRPSASKKLGRQVQLRPDWEEVKVGIMEEIVRAKFTQNEYLKWRLIGTGDAGYAGYGRGCRPAARHPLSAGGQPPLRL